MFVSTRTLHSLTTHLFLFDVVCTEVHCLLINDDNNVVKTLSEYCCQCYCLVLSCMVSVSVPFTELHKRAYLLFWYKTTIFGNKLWKFLVRFYCCTKYCLYHYRNMHLSIVLCCGTERVLFTNNLCKHWCHLIKLYLPLDKVLCMYIFRFLSYSNMHVLF